MRIIAALAVFLMAFAITANMHVYVQNLRLSIYLWHILFPIIPAQLAIALLMRTLLKADRVVVMYYIWTTLFFGVVVASIMATGASTGISDATRYATMFGISVSFLALTQDNRLATAGALGIAFATATAAGVSIAEFVNPDYTAIVDQRYDRDKIKEGVIGRVGGLYINPNSNARFMTFGMFVSCFFIAKKYRLLFCLFVGAAVFTTVSRSGMLTWGLAMVMLAFLGQFARGKLLAKLIATIGIGTIGLLLATGQVPKLLEAAGLSELMSERMIERVSSGLINQGDESTSTRKELVELAIDMYADNPIFGAGVGQSSGLGDIGLGPHNLALEIAAELGTLGLIAFFCVFLIPLSLRTPKALCFLILFTFSGMFAHGILAKAALGFILPTGVVLLARLDLLQRQSARLTTKRRRRRRRRRQQPQVVAQA